MPNAPMMAEPVDVPTNSALTVRAVVALFVVVVSVWSASR
jgi:hypothetical protein